MSFRKQRLASFEAIAEEESLVQRMSTEQYQLSVENNPDPQEVWLIISNLVAYNTSRVGPENYRPLAVFLRDAQGQVVGGVIGATHWDWLVLSHLWLAESVRGQGYGQQLMAAAEKEAVARGCRHAQLDTFSFQACAFHEQRGYEVIGTLEDYPAGHKRYFLQKRDLS